MQPQIYSFEQHQISPKKIDENACYVIEKLRESGFEAYLVGGSVRDLLLNRKPKDFDISTSAKPEEIKKIFRSCLLIGRRFRLAHVRFGRHILEVSTFRTGDPTSEELIVRDNVWGMAHEDVLRRDFTINGLFYDPEKQVIIDYVGGVQDAKEKILRTIGEAQLRFRQDPVRMIRLLKFKARFDMQIDPPALDALYICKKEIMKSSQARILEELFKMLESGSSELFFQYLFEYGLLDLLLPKLAKFIHKSTEKSPIFAYLEQVDIMQWKDLSKKIDRAILLTCLLFPLLDIQLIQYTHTEKSLPHLGTIQEFARQLIKEIFHPFFLIPKRIRIKMISILANQYRFTPIDKKKTKRMRIPKDVFFSHAFTFFKIRTAVHPQFLEKYTEWNAILLKNPQPQKRPTC